MEIPKRTSPSDRKVILVLFALALLARLSCINLNGAEYTDGILQITALDYGFTFWPPLYSLAATGLATLLGDLELAARLVSSLSSALLLLPVYIMTRRIAGRRAAVFASLFYLANPIAGRWAIRVMSDSLFALLFFTSTVALVNVIEARCRDAVDDRQAKRISLTLAMGSLLGALAFLTRLQGHISLWLVLVALFIFLRREPSKRRCWLVVCLAAIPWLIAVAWNVRLLGGHRVQIAERAGGSFAQALLNYWNIAESFVILFPYFITIPVFVLFAVGLGVLLSGRPSDRLFGWVFVAVAVVIIAMQAVFSSFQSRYMLPLVPFMSVMAGVAAARFEEWSSRRRSLARAVILLVLGYSFLWTAAVLLLQRDVFGDIKRAALFCRTLPASARIFSNEYYKPNMPAVKMSFWSGRRVRGYDGGIQLRKGDYICVHSAYGGLSDYPSLRPAVRFRAQLQYLRERYDLDEVAWFEASIVPLLPDVMENPDTHQNPAAWFFRYNRQRFRTVILRINGPRTNK